MDADQPIPNVLGLDGKVISISGKDSPFYKDMIDHLEEVRREIESGRTVALVLVPIHNDNSWSSRSAGRISMLKLSALIGKVWHSCMEALDDVETWD